MTSASIKLPRRPRDILVLAVILIIFGLGEIWVGFFGNYLGILSKSIPPSVSTAIVGFFYCLGGLMLLITRRPWGTTLSLIFIGCEVLGRAYLVAIGVAPARGPDLVKIVQMKESKSRWVAGLEGSVCAIFDDNPHHLEAYMKDNPKGAIIFAADRPWNQTSPCHTRLNTVQLIGEHTE